MPELEDTTRKGSFVIEGKDGAVWEITPQDDGSLRVWNRRGGQIVVDHAGMSGNVVGLVNWPLFTPVRPPAPIAVDWSEIRNMQTDAYERRNGLALDRYDKAMEAIREDPEIMRRLGEIVGEVL